MPGLNYNYNYNYNYSTSGGGGGGRRFRERFNTDYYTRLSVQPPAAGLLVPAPNVPATFAFPQPSYQLYLQNWDSELRAYEYLNRFKTTLDNAANLAEQARTNNAAAIGNWITEYQNAITAAGITPPHQMTQPNMNAQIRQMLDLSLERDPRFCEIIDQDDGDGAINYLLGMAGIDAARLPNTRLMISVGRRIGEFVVMCLKGTYRSPRPWQVSPAITPMFDPPATPAFPAGHAVQAYLISRLIDNSLPNLPRPGGYGTGLLFDLAARIAENRVVAGLHYPVDSAAGIVVANQCFQDFCTGPDWQALRAGVAGELPHYA